MTVSLTFSQSFFEQNVSPTVKIIAIFDVLFEVKSNFNSYVILSLTFSQSFFEQNVSVQLKLLRFSAIFFFKIKPEMRDVLAKIRECGK